ncbi:MAG: Asp-tRNA(Asn)/Glu-tRNA(Gln) amidotransferase subunit GatA, partial [Verrucomicrobia bacterium]|nr:Asp-tRNA(Asn)/Glu-tRNA(Gln) amidotransferase subunit GatA [Verrucomicrobiota bacterium]
ATAIARLRQAGAILLGRTNMDEFAMGSSTENSALGITRNPWDSTRIPGGSSGGSAAAVGGRIALAALGSDTGGSIRQPAALCGCVGLKPTYGRISRYGLVAFASSLDQIGPLTRTVEDSAILLSVLAGHDPRDNTTDLRQPESFLSKPDGSVQGLRIGIPKEYFIPGMDTETEAAVRQSAEWFKKNGATLVDVSLPHTPAAIAVYYILATAEASANLARFDGVRYGRRATDPRDVLDLYHRTRSEGFGPEVKRRIILGTFVLSAGYTDAYYRKAQKVRGLIRQDFEKAFATCDLLLTPTSPEPAFKLGERTQDPLKMYLADVFTISVNLAGNPALSLPCGFTQANLPIGLQLIGPRFGEEKVLQAAHAYEQAHDWHQRLPPA